MTPPAIGADSALFLDFDGTLVEIAPLPEAVQVDPHIPRLLNRLGARLDGALAIVSGRNLAELARLLAPYNGAIAGIHGIERRDSDGRTLRPDPLPFLDHARKVMANFAATTPGVVVEDKGLGVALHFRANPEQGWACLRIAKELTWLSGQRLAITQGKMVVEVHPAGANKGKAIVEFLKDPPFRGRRPIYVGDDRPDESGFVFVNHLGGTTVLVGSNPSTAAQFRLPGVPEVIGWLARSLPGAPPLESNMRGAT